jgi:NAD(P)-dependent dehydrogenase (short-subunit alcohol dehydrogenase family)
MSPQVIIITGASSGFGAYTARLLAQAGHIVYAGMRNHDTAEIEEAHALSSEHKVELRTVICDVVDTSSVNAAVETIIKETGRIDVVIHNAGHGCLGPAEAFSVEDLMHYFDVNTLGTQRLNRAALPHMRKARKGLIVWVSSSSARGGTPPFLGPYFASKAAMDSLAVSYSGELARWGIETSIIVPGAFTKGTNHFATFGKPANKEIVQAYMEGPYKGAVETAMKGLAALEPADAEPKDVARTIVRVVDTPQGKRPFRSHVDPSGDGAEIVNGVADRVRAEMLRRIGLEDVLKAQC